MKKSFFAMVMVFAAIFAMNVSTVNATAVLSLDDGIGNSVAISDGGLGDTNALAGVITYNGSLGSNWIVNVTTGITKPILGATDNPEMDLNSVNVSSSGSGGNLSIKFADDNFAFSGPLVFAVGGTTYGTVNFSSYVNATSINDLGPFGSGSGALVAFADSSSASVSLSPSDTLMLVANISHGNGVQISSFDYGVKVPEPGMLLMFGSGLVGLAFFRRRQA